MMVKVMNKLITLLIVFSISFSAFADGATINEYMGSGVPAEAAKLAGETRGTGLSAAGNSSQSNGTAIRNSVNIFTTVTTSSADSAVLPTKSVLARDDVTIFNNGAGILQVFPQVGGTINNLSTNSSVSVSSGSVVVFKRVSATAWTTLGNGIPEALNSLSTFSTIKGTATESLIAANTDDAADSLYLCVAGGGSCTRTRGGYIALNGNEVSSVGGNVDISTGDGANDTINFYQGSSNIAYVDTNGINLNISGDTLSLQEATTSARCMGPVTFNGTTAVTVSTTCAATGARIFLTPTSDPTGATAAYCWVTNIVNGTSFDVDCDQANDGTANWIIFKESP